MASCSITQWTAVETMQSLTRLWMCMVDIQHSQTTTTISFHGDSMEYLPWRMDIQDWWAISVTGSESTDTKGLVGKS